MTLHAPLQPDQDSLLWNEHVPVYEKVFEPLTDLFAAAVLDGLGVTVGSRVLDVGCGTGGAALEAARRGLRVTAVDAATAMAARTAERAEAEALEVDVRSMDGTVLDFPDGRFDAAISVLGVILFPDAHRGVAEMVRTVRPGGRIAVVAWTKPERYELVARLTAATAEVMGPQPAPPSVPAQLRFRDPAALRELLETAGAGVNKIEHLAVRWPLPSARNLVANIGFAPGIAAMAARWGTHRAAVLEAFAAGLERDQGTGPVTLEAVAHAAFCTRS